MDMNMAVSFLQDQAFISANMANQEVWFETTMTSLQKRPQQGYMICSACAIENF
jgi:hypothetical protein